MNTYVRYGAHTQNMDRNRSSQSSRSGSNRKLNRYIYKTKAEAKKGLEGIKKSGPYKKGYFNPPTIYKVKGGYSISVTFSTTKKK